MRFPSLVRLSLAVSCQSAILEENSKKCFVSERGCAVWNEQTACGDSWNILREGDEQVVQTSKNESTAL